MGPADRVRPYTPERAGALKQRAVEGNPAERQGVLLQPVSGQPPGPSLIPLELLNVLPYLALHTVWPGPCLALRPEHSGCPRSEKR